MSCLWNQLHSCNGHCHSVQSQLRQHSPKDRSCFECKQGDMASAASQTVHETLLTPADLAGPSHGMGLQNMRHVISIRDVVSDTVHQFAPTYHDYVLYSNGNSKVSIRNISPWPHSCNGPAPRNARLNALCLCPPLIQEAMAWSRNALCSPGQSGRGKVAAVGSANKHGVKAGSMGTSSHQRLGGGYPIHMHAVPMQQRCLTCGDLSILHAVHGSALLSKQAEACLIRGIHVC